MSKYSLRKGDNNTFNCGCDGKNMNMNINDPEFDSMFGGGNDKNGKNNKNKNNDKNKNIKNNGNNKNNGNKKSTQKREIPAALQLTLNFKNKIGKFLKDNDLGNAGIMAAKISKYYVGMVKDVENKTTAEKYREAEKIFDNDCVGDMSRLKSLIKKANSEISLAKEEKAKSKQNVQHVQEIKTGVNLVSRM